MPEIPTQPQPNSNQKSINWKRILIVAVIGAVIIGLGVLIFLILQPKPETTSTVTTKKATPSVKLSTPSAEKDETEDWKVHTNSAIGFSISYPQEYKAGGSDISSTIYKGEILESDGFSDPLRGVFVGIDNFTNPKYKSGKEACESEHCKSLNDVTVGSRYSLTNVSINNSTGVRLITTDFPFSAHYYLASKDAEKIVRVYLSHYLGADDKRSDQEKLSDFQVTEKILSTFKFLD